MSKAPKTKRATLHYQPYQAFNNGEDAEQAMDLNISDMPLPLDPVLLGLSSNMSRNLWDDWNENDANFGMRFDMYTDVVTTGNTTGSAASNTDSTLHVKSTENSLDYEQQQNVFSDTITHHTQAYEDATISNIENQQKTRSNVERSLSEDLVQMLDETNETMFTKQLDTDQSSNVVIQGVPFHHGQNTMHFQQHELNHMQQQMQMNVELQRQQQYQQQEHPFQQTSAPSVSSWMNTFGSGTQMNAFTSTSASGKPDNLTIDRHHSHPSSSTPFHVNVAEEAASLNAQCSGPQVPTTPAAPSSRMTTAQHALNNLNEKLGLAISQTDTPSACGATSEDAKVVHKTANANTQDKSSNRDGSFYNQAQQATGFGAQGMTMNPFMMYSMMGPQGINMAGMPMQLPMGMNVNGMNSTTGMMPFPLQMQMQLQLQLQLQMAQLAQINGMGGMNGMQRPMGLPGMPMGLSMHMPLNMNMQQQRINPHSGLSGDIEMVPAMDMPAAGSSMLTQPKGIQGGPGFVNIARKPEEPVVSSILKSLMEDEAKKKEKKLERNRDSARESRRKQQTYVETLENGIKRLQINRDIVRSYRWGVSGPGFGSLPCSSSPEMFDWKNRVAVVTGRTEAFSNIQNPSNFLSLMRLNRQRRTLAIHHQERERAVWKCFGFVGRQLAAMRTRVLQMQILRTVSGNPLAMELDTLLNLTADQKLELQCLAQQMFNEEVLELSKLFKIFYALRNEALRLNMLSPSLERHFRETCSFDQLHRLLQWTENHRTVIETDLCLDKV